MATKKTANKKTNMEILENHIRLSPTIVGMPEADREGERDLLVLQRELKGGSPFDYKKGEHPLNRIKWAMNWAKKDQYAKTVRGRVCFGLVALIAIRHELSEHKARYGVAFVKELETTQEAITADLTANKAHVDLIAEETGLTMELASTGTFWL